ncbi:hypothetical protein FB451DRAFT_1406828 [Mycena latifolia]|nr:hypothetical protein FB451DRAFT_1406828 [Mycena latifolia]
MPPRLNERQADWCVQWHRLQHGLIILEVIGQPEARSLNRRGTGLFLARNLGAREPEPTKEDLEVRGGFAMVELEPTKGELEVRGGFAMVEPEPTKENLEERGGFAMVKPEPTKADI